MKENMDLKAFLNIIKKRYISLVLTVVLIFSFTIIMVTYVMEPTYQASESLLVGVFKNKDAQEMQEVTRIVASTSDFIKSPVVLRKVEKELNIKDIAEKIVVTNNYNSQIINITVRSEDPKFAETLAHTVALTTREKMNELLNSEDITLLSGPEESASLERVDSTVMSLAIGLMVSILAGIALAMTREYLDDSVGDIVEIESLHLRALGEVDLKGKKKSKEKSLHLNRKQNRKFKMLNLSSDLVSTEQIRVIRTNLQNTHKNCGLMMVNSPNLGEQKSLISAKLAISMAEIGKKVLLVDANLDNPSLHNWFNIDNKTGLTNVILQEESIHLHSNYTYISGLTLLTTGPTLYDNSEVWSSQGIKKLISDWKMRYDLIIFETQAFLVASDSQILSQYCDDIILVLKKNSTKRYEVITTKKTLDAGNKNILGVIYQAR